MYLQSTLFFPVTDLLAEYMSERAAIDSLRSQTEALEQELRALTSSFTEAAQRLNNCYKTP